MSNFPRLDFEVEKKNFINSLKITKIQSEPTTNQSLPALELREGLFVKTR